MAALVLVVLILAMAGHSSGNWCACKDGNEVVLQKALDYACGAGADCTPIHQNGACFNPNTVKAHCNYAVNSYYQRKGQATGSCDFAGAATVTATDPSTTGCVYPATASSTPVTTTPTTGTPRTPSTTIPVGGASPYGTTPTTGVLGGVGTGLGPSGVGINTDDSHGGILLLKSSSMLSSLATLLCLGVGLLWG